MVLEHGKSLPKDDWQRKYYWDLRKTVWQCSRCSTCRWIDSWEVKNARFARICPSSGKYLFDTYSAQGRMDVALALIDGALSYEDSSQIVDIMYKCTMCGGCDAACKRVQDMEVLRVMQEIRARLVSDGQLLPAHIATIDGLRREDNMLMQPKANRGKWAEGLGVKNITEESAEVLYHAGCRFSYDEDLWKIARAGVTILKNAGVDIGIMGSEEACCGGPAYNLGYQGEFTKYATHNMELWNTMKIKTIVTPCSDCYQAFKVLYPEADRKVEVLHLVEYLDRLIKAGKIKLTKKVPLLVTYHDPCHLGRMSKPYVPGDPLDGVYQPPRDILMSIPGVELVEMYRIKENAWCCGAGGGVKSAYPDFSSWTAGERIEEAKATGAEALVTACPWCERNFIDAIKERGDTIKIYDVVELVQQAI